MMRSITLREVIKGVPARFSEQYGRQMDEIAAHASPPSTYRDLISRLNALDTETATPEDIAAIIGNPSWAQLECDECGRDREHLVRVGDEPDYDARWQDLCADCLLAAFEMAATKPSPRRAKRRP
jgi:hypothetical protein